MTKANDGGAAYPQMDAEPGFNASERGMSLRDWFAGTLQLTSDDFPGNMDSAQKLVGRELPPHGSIEEVLAWRYELEAKIRGMKADAMLAEREKRNSDD